MPDTKKPGDVDIKVIEGTKIISNKEIPGPIGGHADYNPTIPKGTHIINITQNGKKTEGVHETYTSPTDKIVIYVAPDKKPEVKSKVEVKLVNVTNPKHPIVLNDRNEEGVIGTPFNNTETIPQGYHIISITQNGKVTPQDELLNHYQKDKITIIYKIVKNSPDQSTAKVQLVNVTNPKDPVIMNTRDTHGDIGTTFNDKEIIPKGYHLVKLTENGKLTQVDIGKITQNGKVVETPNGVITPNPKNTIIYHLVPNPKKPIGKAIVRVELPNGKVIEEKPYEGTPGGHFKFEPNIPKGYHIGSITQNGKPVKSPNDILTNPTDKIVYHLVPDKKPKGSAIVKVELPGGKIIQQKTYNGNLNEPFKFKPI